MSYPVSSTTSGRRRADVVLPTSSTSARRRQHASANGEKRTPADELANRWHASIGPTFLANYLPLSRTFVDVFSMLSQRRASVVPMSSLYCRSLASVYIAFSRSFANHLPAPRRCLASVALCQFTGSALYIVCTLPVITSIRL